MVSKMKITLWTMYHFSDETLFEEMVLPDGVDRNIVISTILEECGEFGVLYTDLIFLKEMIGVWSNREQSIWKRLFNTTLLDYNPIENYDRIEDSERNSKGKAIGSETSFPSKNLETVNGTDTEGNDTFKSRIHGNIGTVTSQKMVEDERRVSEFSIYTYIVASFRARFVLDIYE